MPANGSRVRQALAVLPSTEPKAIPPLSPYRDNVRPAMPPWRSLQVLHSRKG